MPSREGLRTIQTIGVPKVDLDLGDADAVVVALKSLTNPASEAVALSLEALSFVKRAGTRQFLFKYCSTFEPGPTGNIGPVTEALMRALCTVCLCLCGSLERLHHAQVVVRSM